MFSESLQLGSKRQVWSERAQKEMVNLFQIETLPESTDSELISGADKFSQIQCRPLFFIFIINEENRNLATWIEDRNELNRFK